MERHLSIDAVRGFAVLGILLMNIVGMGLPSYTYINPSHHGGDGGANLAAWALAFVFVDGKMRTLFTLLFGASLLLIADRRQGRIPSPAAIHHRRMVWLFVFGMIHAWLIWYGDILVPYAIAGSVAFLCRHQPPRLLIGAGLIVLGLLMASGLMGHFQLSQLRAMATAPGASSELAQQWSETLARLVPPPTAAKAEIAGYLGGVAEAFRARMPMTLFMQTYILPTTFLWEALGMMLIGMGIFRLGLFTGRLSARVHARIGAVLIPVGIVLGAQLAGYLWIVRWDPVTMLVTDALALPVHLMMALGYAATVIAIVKSGAARGAVDRLAACGRMAFTNYLGASLITTTLFYGYGYGLYARFERHELYLIVLAVWTLQLGLSKPWLARFRYGPLEWLWRSLTWGERQPFRRAPAPTPLPS